MNEPIRSDLEFHIALAQASGNALMAGMLARLLRPLFTFALARTNEAQQTTTGWGADLPPHREVIYLMPESRPAVAGQFVRHCVGRFVASPQAVWAPEAAPQTEEEILTCPNARCA